MNHDESSSNQPGYESMEDSYLRDRNSHTSNTGAHGWENEDSIYVESNQGSFTRQEIDETIDLWVKDELGDWNPILDYSMRNEEDIIPKDEKSVLEYQNKKNITEESCMIIIEPLINMLYPTKAPIYIVPDSDGSQTGIKYLEEGRITGRAFPDQALIIAPNSFTTQLGLKNTFLPLQKS